MDLPPTPGGVSTTAKPPEVVISDIDPALVVDEDNNGNENTVRHSRPVERSSSADGGARLGTSDDLRKQSFRKASAEREKKRKREKEIAYQNAKAKEESFFDAFSGIVRECKTANIATNPHLIQMRIDVERSLEIQEDHKLALASLGAAMNKMSLQMDQMVAMGHLAGTKLENLKSGDVSLSDTEGLQNCLEGLHQKMREDVANCINNAASIPPSKRPRLGEPPGRRLSVPDENHIENVEMTDVSTDVESETDAPIRAAPSAAPAKSKQGKLISPRQRREIDHEARLQAEAKQNSKSYAEVTKPSGGRQNDQPKKRAPRNRGRRGQSSGDRESDNNNGSNDDGRRGDRSRSKNRDNSRGRDKSPKYVKKTYQVINDDKGYNFMESEVEWIKIESKTKNQKRRQNKRFKISEESSDKEVILHNIPTLDRAGVPETAEADADRAIKVLRELQRGGYTLKNGHITGTERQVRNNRNKGFQPITISLKDGDIADDIKLAASKVGLLDARDPKTNDSAEDNIGYLRKSLSEEERKKIGATKRFFESKAGKALKQIRKRQYDSTTNASAWSKINVELGASGSVAAGQTRPPVIEKPEATRAALRLLAETGSEAAETLLKELAAAEAAAEAANKKQDNHENNTDY
jgi:hypothetical protein